MLVHDGRRLVVLERLVLHHVAPVAGGIADREQDRSVLAPGASERLLAPGIPVDGVARMLEQVRARLGGQAVHAALRLRKRPPSTRKVIASAIAKATTRPSHGFCSKTLPPT